MSRLQVTNETAWRRLHVDPHNLPHDAVKLEALKKVAQERFRMFALQLHPDVTGGDVAKERTLKTLSTAYAEIKGLQLVTQQPVRRPVPQYGGVVIIFGGYTWTGGGSTTNGGGFSW